MSKVTIEGNASGTGTFTIAAPNSNTDRTLTLPDAGGEVVSNTATQTLTNKTLEGGALTSATAVTASGTSVDFTSIPSWVKRITVMFNRVSTNGTSIVQIQVGSSTFSTSGYDSHASHAAGSNQFATSTTGLIIGTPNTSTAAAIRSGAYQIILVSGNSWVGAGTIGVGGVSDSSGGSAPELSGALDQVRITTVGGVNTFDAGTINIMYEG